MTKKSDLINKSLIIGIIVLFFGAAVVPSISGYEKKTNLQTEEKAPAISCLDCDYVNSYWRFTECSGDIAVDSCSPYYNGTIHGASWAGSGGDCSLLFDGVDDYVDFNSYASEIMFNKTDDIILSFYFKSTGDGLIFSATAPWGNNPEFRIELVSNGSLLFYKITQQCGIILYSTGTYNDGDWHHAKYYYNGISSNPSVTLFVDDVFDNNITHWLCEIENDDYAKTKMGMHSHFSTDYYDGYIDEFKIIKYENGNKQVPPTISGPTYGDPGVEYDYTFITNDPEEDDIEILIDWGNGDITKLPGLYESGEEVTISYQWDEEGIYCIKAKSMDIWDDSMWSDCFNVKIGNNPPNAPTIDGQNSGKTGKKYDFIFNTTDPDNDSIAEYIINWGDGSAEEIISGPFASGEEVTGSHSWTSPETFTIKAKAKDIYGAGSEWREFTINIPRNRVIYHPLPQRLFDRFPLLERLLTLFRLI
jgi:hypothetical protein